MKVVLLLTGLAVLYSVAAHTTSVFANPIVDSVHLRAGVKKPNSSFGNERLSMRGGKKSNKKKPSKYGGSSSKKKNRELIQYSGRGKAKKGPGLRDKLEKIAKQGQSIYKDVYRRAKVLQSSAFESMLLKATWPSNDPVQPEILGEIVKYSIPAFKFASSDTEDDPYYMTLHKLWTKMSEKDWRTVAKSLYILHTIQRDCQVGDCQKFGAAIKDMAKTRNPKNPEHRYFEIGRIAELDDAGEEFEPFVRAYSTFVVTRAKTFSARFEELKSADGKGGSEKKVLAALKKAQQLISAGLRTEIRDKKLANAITGHAVKQVALDLRDLHAQLGGKVALFMPGGKYASSQSGNAAAIADALKFYLEFREKVKSFLSRSAKMFVRLRVKIPTDLDTSSSSAAAALTPDSVAARIKELTNLSGGSSPSSDSSSSSSNSNSRRVLQRAERPLSPEEVQWSVELQSLSSAKSSAGKGGCTLASKADALSRSRLLQDSIHQYGGSSEGDEEDEEEEQEDEQDELDAGGTDKHSSCSTRGQCIDDDCDDAACDAAEANDDSDDEGEVDGDQEIEGDDEEADDADDAEEPEEEGVDDAADAAADDDAEDSTLEAARTEEGAEEEEETDEGEEEGEDDAEAEGGVEEEAKDESEEQEEGNEEGEDEDANEDDDEEGDDDESQEEDDAEE